MIKWLFSALMVIQAHSALTYLVPANTGQGWVGWPWAAGDAGVLGTIGGSAGGSPLIGVWLAGLAGIAFILAALSVAGFWIPPTSWRPAAIAGAMLSLVLMSLFFGPTKMLPIALDFAVLAVVVLNWNSSEALG